MSAPPVLRLGEHPAEDLLHRFVEVAASGGLVLFPTDTVYGVGARADREAPLRRLFAAKQRPAGLALPVLLGETEHLPRVAAYLPPAGERLVQRFWPGPLTLVVPRREELPALLTAGLPTVGVRVPDHAELRRWLAAGDFPLAASSANLSGSPEATRVEDLPAELVAAVDLVLDGGPCPGGVASTVVDVTIEPPRVLREGPIGAAEIAEALQG